MPLSPGQTLQNRYRVAKLIGQGGFGAVYRAWDTALNQPCALKENLDTSPEAQRQFQREASILAGLSHPGLPHVYDHFFISGQGQYLVMSFVDGEDLQIELDQHGPLPEARVLAWAAQVCDALAYMHSQPSPIVHRDIKPANIKICPDDRAMLVDFGIAKVYQPQIPTTSGARAVTSGYSPPEQYGPGRTDPRSDIYALGATLYALLTGQPPPDAIDRLINGIGLRPPRQLNSQVSPVVEQVILKAMEVSPDRRFQSAGEFHAALTQSPDHTSLFWWLGLAVVAGLTAIVLTASLLVVFNRLNPDLSTPTPDMAALSVPTLTGTPTPMPTPTSTPVPTPMPTSRVFIEYILSSANSMMQPLRQSRKLDIARQALARHWEALPPGVNVGLRVYGDRYSATDEVQSCHDTHLLAPPGVRPVDELRRHVASLEARGLSPVTEVLYMAAGDFNFLGSTNAIILIADGDDNCGRDSCGWARTQIQDTGLPLPVYIVGLGIGESARSQLACVAESSGGLYRDANDEGALLNMLNEMAGRVMQR